MDLEVLKSTEGLIKASQIVLAFTGIIFSFFPKQGRVSVQGVKSHASHFACLCQGFEFYEVKKKLLLFFKKKMEILLHFLLFL